MRYLKERYKKAKKTYRNYFSKLKRGIGEWGRSIIIFLNKNEYMASSLEKKS